MYKAEQKPEKMGSPGMTDAPEKAMGNGSFSG